MGRRFTNSCKDDALPNCLSSWIIHEYTHRQLLSSVVVTDTQAYYYIDIYYKSQLCV